MSFAGTMNLNWSLMIAFERVAGDISSEALRMPRFILSFPTLSNFELTGVLLICRNVTEQSNSHWGQHVAATVAPDPNGLNIDVPVGFAGVRMPGANSE